MGLLCSERGGGTENGKAHAVGVEREKAGHPPRKLEKGFRGELIYNKKASWILIKLVAPNWNLTDAFVSRKLE